MGRIKPKQEEEPEEILTDVWEHEEIANKKSLPPITAPKIALPTHAESYNPVNYNNHSSYIKQYPIFPFISLQNTYWTKKKRRTIWKWTKKTGQ